jgi:hypothetical protein
MTKGKWWIGLTTALVLTACGNGKPSETTDDELAEDSILTAEELTEEERANIGVIAGDGAKWIDQCKDEYFRNATRCMDPFHVCTWATEAVDRVRIDATRKAARECRAQETAFLKEEEQELGRLGLDSIMAYVAELDGQPEYDGMEPWKKVLFAGLMAYQQPLSEGPSGKKGKRRKKKLSPEHQAVPDQMEGNARGHVSTLAE